MIDKKYIDKLMEMELDEAKEIHPEYFASDHEAYAVIKEELEEVEIETVRLDKALDIMWLRVKNDLNIEDVLIDMKKLAYYQIAEAIQVYAMCEKALRTLIIREEI